MDSCMNCRKPFGRQQDKTSRYGQRKIILTHRLQDRILEKKKNVTVLDSLEELMPTGTLPNSSIIMASKYFVCVPCMVLLRQFYNKKCDAKAALKSLHQRLVEPEEAELLAARQDERETKCCLCAMTSAKHVKSEKVTMDTKVLKDMTLQEAIEAILPDYSRDEEALFVCKMCFGLIRITVSKQHRCEEFSKQFFAKSSPRSPIKRFLGETTEEDDDEDEEDYNEGDDLNGRLENSADGLDDEDSSCFMDSEENFDSSQSVTFEMVDIPQEAVAKVTESIELGDFQQGAEIGVTDVQPTGSLQVNKTGTDDSNLSAEQMAKACFNVAKESALGAEGKASVKPSNKEEDDTEFIQTVTDLLKQRSYSEAVELLVRSGQTSKSDFIKILIQFIRSEVKDWSDVESSSWSKILTSADSVSLTDVAMETLITEATQKLPTLTSVLAECLVDASVESNETRDRKTVKQLIGLLSTVLQQTNPRCCLVPQINSYLMAKAGCSSELLSVFHDMGYCLDVGGTGALLARLGLDWDTVQTAELADGMATGRGHGPRGRSRKRKGERELGSKQAGKKPRLGARGSARGDVHSVIMDESNVDWRNLLRTCLVNSRDPDREDNLGRAEDGILPQLTLQSDSLISSGSSCSTEKGDTDSWQLYYYPNVSGSAEFIRLLFEEAGVSYTECGESFDSIRELVVDGKMDGFPAFAPPVVRKGQLQLSQVPVICRHLGEEFGLYPDSLADRVHTEQLSQTCYDYFLEGRFVFLGNTGQSVPTEADVFVRDRIPRYLNFFEKVLTANNHGNGYLIGKKQTYADLALLQVLRVTEAMFPETWSGIDDITVLKAYKDRLSSQPRLAEYFRSCRCQLLTWDTSL